MLAQPFEKVASFVQMKGYWLVSKLFDLLVTRDPLIQMYVEMAFHLLFVDVALILHRYRLIGDFCDRFEAF